MANPEATPDGLLTRILDRTIDLAVLLFACWTLVYLVGLGVGATRLQVTMVATLGALGVIWWSLARGAPVPIDPELEQGRDFGVLGWLAALSAVAAVMLAVMRHDTWFWLAATAATVVAAVSLRRLRPRESRRGRSGAGLVLAVALAAGVVSATQIDWIKDNTYYVDRAYAIRDAPGSLPLGRDTFFSASGTYPSLVPENDLSSLEGLVGSASAIVGGHPMSWLSYVVHPVFGFLGVLALWRAARALSAPRPELVALLGTVGVFLVSLQSEIGTRAFSSRTGRTGFVAFLVPVLVAYTAEIVSSPGSTSALRFVAAGVAAGGLTLSALPVTPVIVIATVVAAWRPAPPGKGRWLIIAGAAVFAFFLVLTLAAFFVGRSPIDQERTVVAGVTPAGVLWRVALGPVGSYVPLSLVILLGWAAATTRTVRRFLVAAPAATLVLLLSPPSLWLIHKTAVATSIARLGWSLPLALLIGLVCAAVWGRHPIVGPAAVVALLGVVAISGPRVPLPRLGLPGWDVPAAAAAAVRLSNLSPPGGTVAAPWRVIVLVPVVSNDVFPLALTEDGVAEIAEHGFPEPDARLEIMSWLSGGAQGRDPQRLADALDAVDVAALCVRRPVRSPDVSRGLHLAGFHRAGGDEFCRYWVRSRLGASSG